ncbi:hypothetical protein AOLI_G00271780 [Acnodon oligacanthus]
MIRAFASSGRIKREREILELQFRGRTGDTQEDRSITEMDRITIISLILSVLCRLPARAPRHYFLINEVKNWPEAQRYCTEKNADLATVHSMDEMKELNEILRNSSMPGDFVWIGLQRGVTERWMWSLADTKFYKQGETEFRKWKMGEPRDSSNNDQDCAVQYSNGSWGDEKCDQKNVFFCFDGVNNTYHSENKEMSWHEAQRFCRKQYTDLVSVRNDTENSKVSAHGNAWIGLFRDSWTWSDQSNSSFRYWGSGQPHKNEKCAAVWTGRADFGQWKDLDCNKQNPFVCSGGTSQQLSVSTTVFPPGPMSTTHGTTTGPPDTSTSDQRLSVTTTVFPSESTSTTHGTTTGPPGDLVLVTVKLTWKEALKHCRDSNMDLVSVHSEEIQRSVVEVARNASTSHAWLGLRHTCALDLWFWASGTFTCYKNWAPGNETGVEDCSAGERTGAVQTGGKQQWVSLPENQRLNFICSRY